MGGLSGEGDPAGSLSYATWLGGRGDGAGGIVERGLAVGGDCTAIVAWPG